MKNFKTLMLFLLLLANNYYVLAQITLTYPTRTQRLNQYTSVFICSPNNGTVIQNIHDDSEQTTWAHSDHFYAFNNLYTEIPQDPAQSIMQAGKGYVLQLGGNGVYSDVISADRVFDFTGGSANNGTVSVGVSAGQLNLLGNPYNNFLDLDLFLLNPTNATKVKGPVRLWTHNTIASGANINPDDPSPYRFSANDFALYNVLGGVASGREISTSSDTGTSTGVQTPNGKICFGTGFSIYSIGSGNIVYENAMRTSDNGGVTQSFRESNNVVSNNEVVSNSDRSNLPAAPPAVRSRIWLNIEKGIPPTSGNNYNPLKQILIGYSPCFGSDCPTVGDSDRVFDAETVTADTNPKIDFYSFAANSTKKLAIQGRGDFQKNDFFLLGYKATYAGDYTFTSTSDGIFAPGVNQQTYYILDALDAEPIRHTFPYTFTTASGVFDSRFTVVFKNLVSITFPACGTQLANIWNTVYSTQIPGVTVYKFKVANADGSPFGAGIFDSPPSQLSIPYDFNLNLVGITLNTSYLVSVATYTVDGVWQFGPPCQFITPLYPSTTFLSNCAATPTIITNYNQSIYGRVITERGMTSNGYRFQVSTTSSFTTGTIVGTIQKTVNNFSLAELRPSYFPIPSTTYFIRMQIEYNGAWVVDTLGNPVYGSVCQVQTNSNPGGRLSNIANTIFEAIAYPNPFATAFKLEINTSSDQIVFVKTYDMIGRLIDSQEVLATEIGTQEIGSTFPAGVYNIVVSQGDNVKTMRVIKR